MKNKITISKSTSSDKDSILDFLALEFNFMTKNQIDYELNMVNYDRSIKATDENSNIVGVILLEDEVNLSDYIKKNVIETYNINVDLNRFNHRTSIHGGAFVIDKKLRGTGLDKSLIKKLIPTVSKYDYVFVGVFSFLKTHNYWKRFGFKEVGFFKFKTGDVYVYFYEF